MSVQDATSVPLPITPTPENATLPGAVSQKSHSIEGSQSPQTKTTAAASSSSWSPSPSLVLAATPSPCRHQPTQHTAGSTTPDSQAPLSHLSSPPPTVQPRLDTTRSTADDLLSLPDERISNASAETLRSIVRDLLPALQEARTDAAHYRLQYQMLAIESAETVERIQVEMDMAQRELEVLQAADQRHQAAGAAPALPVVDPSMRSVHVDLYKAMTDEMHALKSRNLRNEAVIAQQKRMIVQQEGDLASMHDRITLLRERLQETRDQRNRDRGASLAPDVTPRSEKSTPHRAPQQGYPASARPREQRPFAALMHASDLMSRGPPSTPKRKRVVTPPTPQTTQPRASRNVYETPRSSRPTHPRMPMSAPAPRIASFSNRVADLVNSTGSRITNRHGDDDANESEGTISATDDSEAETEVPDDEDVGTSRASVMASEFLRTPTRPRSRGQQQQQQQYGSGMGQPLTQTRLFGQVKKSIVHPGDDERQAKRSRGGEALGLGITAPRE